MDGRTLELRKECTVCPKQVRLQMISSPKECTKQATIHASSRKGYGGMVDAL